MKFVRLLSVLIVIVIIAGAGLINAGATPAKPYGSYSATVGLPSTGDEYAQASISRCSCYPVENFLLAGVAARVIISPTIYMRTPDTGYVEASSSYTDYQSRKIYPGIVAIAYGQFKAACKNGSQLTYTDTAYR